MTTPRDIFLTTVRAAVAAGNQAGHSVDMPTGPRIGYQGGGANLVQRFGEQLQQAGGFCHVVAQLEGARQKIVDLIVKASAKRVMLSNSQILSRLQLGAALRQHNLDVWDEHQIPARDEKAIHFAAEVGVTGVDALIAETGSIVLAAQPARARSTSLLPPVHIAVAERDQLLPDLFDLFDNPPEGILLPSLPSFPTPSTSKSLPTSCLTLITGPSKTGDIELRLVTGVHGPGEVHVVLIDSGPRS